MKNYPAIALLSLLGLSLSATCALSTESPLPQLETSTAQYMLSAQTQQRGDRAPRRGSGRYDLMQTGTVTQALQ
ncbi:MAG: hypothetical protein JGK17_13220 [Microcoleus sp. PH2017_10_PVI_O_A]|uniref:heterocyst-inhibiting protein PatX n=1 Tax=unclassified Microcoleus TaxID=2642155 RepID=UPI001E1688DC|nr:MULTISPECIES: hypothetical protein [unclassified Microcoleus]TAE76996.1 MAG: hypothetical protein EAZ83_27330 [Oscillatoriales cyanobacterium]MCC3406523.1 hypothetical protein [Microcoleus sp. PH2017_10_PVI_O_A]MCC3463356.1 hypothetical protein [Microcoleus sp. PH2017_11_PCY_U_A]MCC3481737.1 hypothetical protein [Microcoleus sp. PH2017_12_PCY_D_A]MCC3529287.1 hypothetical protein [Microcoleus sp. PH2017_21_RUC_O_A]